MYSKDSQLIIVIFICPKHVIHDLFTKYIGMSHPTFPAKPKNKKMVDFWILNPIPLIHLPVTVIDDKGAKTIQWKKR